MAKLATIEEILKQSQMDREEKLRILGAYASRERAVKEEKSWKTRSCPGCGSGLKIRDLFTQTLFYCGGCAFTHIIPFLMDEARPMGTSYIPGVTGKPTPTVIFSADGKTIKKVMGA